MSTLLTESQRHQLLIEWNNTASDYPYDQCVHQLFEAQVAHTPNATAVVFENQSLTYQQLNQKANQLAHYLRKLGVGAEVLVGIHVERSLEMIIGLLGILKAGGAYVPLDPAYPQERLMFMLADAQVRVLLTQSLFAERIGQLIPQYSKQKLNIVYLDGDWGLIEQASKDNVRAETRPENLAYVIYTSGSTGKPKGVLLEHRGLCNLSTAQTQIFDVQEKDKILQFASLNFDASIWEIIMALIPGATLCLGTRDTFLSSHSLFNFLNEQAITVATLPPSVLNALPFKALPSLRKIIVAGENCSIKLATQWSSICRFFNAYGPTETTVCATVFEYTQETQKLPIGYPITNTQVYILDAQQQLVPIGTPGELYIGGAGLARGYLNRPELTTEKFIPNPFSDDPQARLYKTGDLVRHLPDGNIEFLGRIDNQVKIRGFRIELEEIEAVLNQDSTVKEAVVLVQEDSSGNKQLIAYIVSKLIPDRLPIQSLCTVKFEGFRAIALKTEDISCNGVCLAHVPLFCKPDQQVQLQLQLPDIPDKFWLSGKVAWCRGQRAGIALFADSKGQDPLCQTVEYLLEKQGFLKTLQRSCTLHLREYLKEKLPEYMIPANFVMLTALPLTPNGKVDRQALLTTQRNTAHLAENFEAPQTPTEEILVNIWREVLKREYISVHDNFLELGGHSLLATQVISQLRALLQIELPLYRLFELATIKKIAEYIEASYQEEAEETEFLTPPIQAMERHHPIPLSFPQQQLWLLAQVIPDVPVYNEPISIRLGGSINSFFLEHALNDLLQRHEILRTTFVRLADQPIQFIHPHAQIQLPLVDLSALPTHERETEALRLATQEAQKPFDLTQAPLLRATLMRVDETDYRLFLTFHHIIFDGVSFYNVFLPELEHSYYALSQNSSHTLAPLTLQYADFALWQRQTFPEQVFAQQLIYWQQKLAHLTPLQLPTDRPRPAQLSFKGNRYRFSLAPKLTQALKTLSYREGVTLFTLLLAAFKTLLYRYSAQEDIAVGSVTAGAQKAELEPLIGYFVNIIVLRSAVSAQLSFHQLLQQVRKTTLEAYIHQDLPFEQLVKALQPQRDSGINPLFQVAFSFDPPLNTETHWVADHFEIHPQTAKFDLTLELGEQGEQLSGQFEYNTDLFEEQTIARMVGHFQTLLLGVVAQPNQLISALPLLTAAEHQQFLAWNQTQAKFPDDQCIHQLFEHQVRQAPAAIAVVFEQQQLNYQLLNARANQLAHHLIQLGVQADTLVGICIERSLEMIIGILGILKAGGAYVPLDPNYPHERLSFMLEDAQVPILLTQYPLAHLFDAAQAYRVVYIDQDWPTMAQYSQHNPMTQVKPEHLVYMIYTSGSTGKPKGVMVAHRGLCNLAKAQSTHFNIQSTDTILQFSSLSYDASIWEIIMALTSGACLCLTHSEALFGGYSLLKLLQTQAITTMTLPPSVLATLPVETLPDLKTLIVAGEQCSPAVLEPWAARYSVFNAYGPTESTVCATISSPWLADNKTLSIGYPIINTQVYVLDAALQLVPIGIPGELYIGGVGLARGYLNRPQLTAEKFIPNPFDSESKLYKTGDLVRYLPDGSIEFLGRIDNQVKIRGIRIELGEIEAVLNRYPSVQLAVVKVHEDKTGDKKIIAYLETQALFSEEKLRAFLKDQLPHYMMPSALVFLERLPLTPNGKVDYRALPIPENIQRTLKTTWVAPRTLLELQLIALWEAILNVPSIGVRDNFFELGGHSLLAVRLMAEIQQKFSKTLPISILFQSPTIEKLALLLQQSQDKVSESPLVAIQPRGKQLPFFCIPGSGGNVIYFRELAHYLGQNQPFYALQAPGLEGKTQPYTQVETIAQYYLQLITTVQPQGPYLLGGHSFGGSVAFEMAQQLTRQGQTVALLAILDTPIIHFNSDELQWDDTQWLVTIARVIEHLSAQELEITYEAIGALTPEEQLIYFKKQLEQKNILPEATDMAQVRGMIQVIKANELAHIHYQPKGNYPGIITLFRTDEVYQDILGFKGEIPQDASWGWSQLTTHPVAIHYVPGDHSSMLTEPHVASLAQKLKKCIEQIQAGQAADNVFLSN